MDAYAFDRFVFAPDSRRLDGPGGRRELRPKTARLLCAFLERPRQVVTKGQIFECVWPDTAVVDNVLAQGVRELRLALGDDARAPRFLRTRPEGGYEWLMPVEHVSLAATVADPGAARHVFRARSTTPVTGAPAA